MEAFDAAHLTQIVERFAKPRLQHALDRWLRSATSRAHRDAMVAHPTRVVSEFLRARNQAKQLHRAICDELGVDPEGIVLHSNNGGPMKGSTMLATLEALGIVASFGRPRPDQLPRPLTPSTQDFALSRYRAWCSP